MVIKKSIRGRNSSKADNRGMLMTELMVAIAILMMAVMPIGYSLTREAHELRSNYQRAVAMEIVDGEIEILAAGEGRTLPEGTHPYSVHAAAAVNLPDGEFQVTRNHNHLRLQWKANERQGFGIIAREATLK
jgi:hypothetical protein